MKPGKISIILAAAGVMALAVQAAAMGYIIDSPNSAAGWAYEVHTRGLPRVDNVTFGPDKSIFVTLERSNGKGEIVKISNGEVQTVVRDMSRPDGLVANDSALYVSEEVKGGRILKIGLKDFNKSVVAKLKKPEGIKVLPDGTLVVAQDNTDGRILKISRDGVVTIVAEHINRPEGLTLGSGGEIFVAETETGRILKISERGVEPYVEGLILPDQVAMGPDGALWITEDRAHARLMRFYSGRLETVLENLIAPQGIAVVDATSVYVAEQGRNRLLRVHRAD